jgi:16S rRNA (cytosine967-C5)-methyltransferase
VTQRSARSVDPGRLVAWQVLRAVDADGAYANLALPRLAAQAHLDARERALATELAYGTLRGTGTLDHLIALALDRPVGQLDPPVRDVLRLGAYQLLRTRQAVHAVVDTSVDLVASEVGHAPRGLVNAVLRKLAVRCGGPDPLGLSDVADPVARLALEHSHPRWIVRAFTEALGGDPAGLLAADDERPEVHLVARTMSRDELLRECQDAGLDAAPGHHSPIAVRLRGGDPGSLRSVRRGYAAVQDEGSQLVALALAAAPAPAGPSIDLCAGPGGKSALLPAPVLALELHHHRAQLVRAATPSVVVGDGRRAPLRPGTAARVLVDAPCSGLGALRRRPEARWRRKPQDIGPLTVLQRELLAAGLELLQPGGVLAYVTCSPHLDETVRVVQGHDLMDARPLIPGVGSLGAGPWVQLWPHLHGTDAMFLALIRKPQ